jgi:hypothetical protein
VIGTAAGGWPSRFARIRDGDVSDGLLSSLYKNAMSAHRDHEQEHVDDRDCVGAAQCPAIAGRLD